MKRRILVSVTAILAIAFFEFYMRTQVDLTDNTLPKCFPTGEMFPYKDAYGNIKYDSVYHTIADFKLTDQNGETFTNSLLRNKIYVANFFFATCPSICPKMTSHMKVLQEEFSNYDQVAFLSHTIFPEHDSVAVLKEYEIKNQINGKQWHLLTGTREELYNLSKRSYYLGVENDSPDNFQHSEKLVLVDNHRVIRGYYDGTSRKEIQKLKQDMKILLCELEKESKTW